ncbi:glycoprotein integral membrane protein 1 [Protopterus annectens]|uniref:glycoprotein integral membrane protein 1 n=1 Tax=Protopterus annectens TaxID=7888 RepID=UPI001CFA198D|nr:glycoprotein integral membrane protein 1 [Protopterus annectens]
MEVFTFLALMFAVVTLFTIPLQGLGTAAPKLGEASITVNVTSSDGDEVQNVQIVLKIIHLNGQVFVNDLPVKYNGVSRLNCRALILELDLLNKTTSMEHLGNISVRVLVRQWPLESSPQSMLLVVQEEVTEVDGRQVNQEDVTEMELLIHRNLEILRQSVYVVPLKESMLYSIPRNSDLVITLPNLSGKVDIQGPLQTTSHYPLNHMETTVDEASSPGKLPETPLRAELPSSYKVMCQWVEDLRKELCRLWVEFFPVFFSFMEVVFVGVVGAAIIINILKVFFPSCEQRNTLKLDHFKVVPVEITPLLMDLTEMQQEEDSVEKKTII